MPLIGEHAFSSEVEKEKCDVRRPPGHNSASSVASI